MVQAIVIHTADVLPNAINDTIYSTPVAQYVYLKNLSGDLIKYPKIGSTYKCWVDALPPDNKTLLSVKWYYVGPGINAQSGVDAVQHTDAVSWYTNGSLSPTKEGNIECDITIIDSSLVTRTFNQTFVVTTPTPTCTHDDYCTMSGSQSYSNNDSAVTSRYENLTIASGATLTAPKYATQTYKSQRLNLIVDNELNITGTLKSIGTNRDTNNCKGGDAEILSLQFRTINLSGTIEAAGGAGWASCGCSDRKSTRLNSSHIPLSRMPSSA